MKKTMYWNTVSTTFWLQKFLALLKKGKYYTNLIQNLKEEVLFYWKKINNISLYGKPSDSEFLGRKSAPYDEMENEALHAPSFLCFYLIFFI